MDDQQAYQTLGRMIETMPNLLKAAGDKAAIQWLARVQALLSVNRTSVDLARLNILVGWMVGNNTNLNEVNEFTHMLYRALSEYELKSPINTQGAFVGVGNSFDALVSVGNLLKTAKDSVRIIDPYMDDRILSDFSVLAAEHIKIELLTDSHSVRPNFSPAVKAFVSQFGVLRPLEARLTSPRTLHDRLIIIDATLVWSLTQSLKDFAARSPASIVRVEDETAKLKAAVYEGFWQSATPV